MASVRSALVAAVALVAILSLASVAFAKPTWEQLDNYHFDQYVHDFARVYRDADEKHMRRALFERALDTIRSHNRRNLSWKMGVNHFTDRTEDEKRVVLGYRQDIGYLRRGDGRIAQELVAGDHTVLANLPTSVDWRKAGIVSPVKDQGHCGSCWSFAAASTLESFYALITGQLPTLSEQQILSCTPNPDECGGTGGCAGGTAELAFSTLLEHGSGIASEWVYPYMSYRGSNYKCHFSPIRTPIAANISGVVKLPANQYSPLMNAVATLGPISISVDASAWHSYESGVFTGCNATSIDINHAVVLVGYGTDAQFGDYWLVRNSWSPTWGEQGYVRIARSSTPKCGIDSTPADGTGCKGGPTSVYCCGECGILYDSSYPIVFPSAQSENSMPVRDRRPGLA